MNSVPMYSIITTKKSIKHPVRLLFHLTFASWCLPYKTPAAISQYIWAPIFHCTSFPFGRFPDGNLCHVDCTWLPSFHE